MKFKKVDLDFGEALDVKEAWYKLGAEIVQKNKWEDCLLESISTMEDLHEVYLHCLEVMIHRYKIKEDHPDNDFKNMWKYIGMDRYISLSQYDAKQPDNFDDEVIKRYKDIANYFLRTDEFVVFQYYPNKPSGGALNTNFSMDDSVKDYVEMLKCRKYAEEEFGAIYFCELAFAPHVPKLETILAMKYNVKLIYDSKK